MAPHTLPSTLEFLGSFFFFSNTSSRKFPHCGTNKVFFFSTQAAQGLDQVTLVNPPAEPLPRLLLEVEYSCDDVSQVQLKCIVSFDTGNTATLPLRQWDCAPGGLKTRNLAVKLPDWLVYQADGIVPDYQGVESCDLVASVRSVGVDDGVDGEDELVTAQDVASLQLRPFFDRPLKQHRLCLSWNTQMLHLRRSLSKRECPAEEGTIVDGPDNPSSCFNN